MTAGQKAAETKRAKAAAAAGHPAPAKAAPAPASATTEAATVPVTLTVDATSRLLTVTCSAYPWKIVSEVEDASLLVGVLQVDLVQADVEQVLSIAAEMNALHNLLTAACEESDDDSLPFIVSTLAGHYRASSIELIEPSGRREIRRGQSYMALHQLVDAYLSREGRGE